LVMLFYEVIQIWGVFGPPLLLSCYCNVFSQYSKLAVMLE
jgi:hypothetical protein